MGLGVHPRSVLKSSFTTFPRLLQNVTSRSTARGFSGHPALYNSNSCGMLSKRAGHRNTETRSMCPVFWGWAPEVLVA